MSEKSPALQLLTLVWQHKQEATGHSWLRLNQAMRSALNLAVEAGMRFGPDDLKDTNLGQFRPGYWFHGEMFYRRAVAYRNASAWKACENAWGRKAFIIKGAKLPRTCEFGGGRMDGDLPRLVIGAEFKWKGEQVSVTSFNDEKQVVVACSSMHTPSDGCKTCHRCLWNGETKLLHRYAITHADIRAVNTIKAAKETGQI